MPISNQIPTVIVSNFAEAHVDFLGRCADPKEREELILSEAYHADRTLLWAGDPKLVIVSYPIAHADFIRQRLNFQNTAHAFPAQPTYYLSKDILREVHLLEKIVGFAGNRRTLQLIPYATTPEFLELVGVLREQYGLDVHTPESPEQKDFWLRDYIDTKNGFRSLASMWLNNAADLLTLGFSCYDMDHAFKVVEWFSQRGETCVVKADTGESGIGTVVVAPFTENKRDEILNWLKQAPYFDDELIVVESFIPSSRQVSPSLEIKVPPLGMGKPEVTYVSRQLFLNFGDFCGIQIDKSLYESSWYPKLETSGLLLAERLQEMGYVGHFDMDCIVRDDEHLYLLEINARRTGGTHVHEFAKHFYGDDYIEKTSFISYEAMDSGMITDPDELMEALKDFLLPINGDERHGLIVTITRALHLRRFGCIAIARTADLALKLQQDVQAHIRNYKK
ncbi:MAG: hypothetical protein OHK003_15200 [Anaerolineales bacterium]